MENKIRINKKIVSKIIIIVLAIVAIVFVYNIKRINNKIECKGYLWVAKKDEIQLILVGTIHQSSSKYNLMNKKLKEIIKDADELLVEVDLTDENIEERKKELLSIPNNETIESYLSNDEYSKLESIIKKLNGDFNEIKNKIPEGISMEIEELMYKKLGYSEDGLDLKLMKYAKNNNIKISELEGVEKNLQIRKQIYGIDYLKQYINNYSSNFENISKESVEKSLEVFSEGNLEAPEEEVSLLKKQNEQYYNIICKNRNEDIVNKINSLAKCGKKQIVAIGYNHYFGSDSVKTLLEKDGYEITEY